MLSYNIPGQFRASTDSTRPSYYGPAKIVVVTGKSDCRCSEIQLLRDSQHWQRVPGRQ